MASVAGEDAGALSRLRAPVVYQNPVANRESGGQDRHQGWDEMSKQKTVQPRYIIGVYDEPNAPGVLRFIFVPKGRQQARSPREPSKPVPEYIVCVHGRGKEAAFMWVKSPRKEATKTELEEIARARVTERAAWIQRVSDLVEAVESWARDFGWSTKRIDKKIDDNRLGYHKAAGLVMQHDTVRLLLEPISASAPGSDGLVDLCLMPGYDDIASLYHQEGGWLVYYVFPTKEAVAGIKEGETRPLSKKTLGVVLDEMKKHAE